MNESYEDRLREKNLRLTAVRLAVLEVVDTYPHSDAHSIFEAIKKRIPRATIQAIYNNLNALTDVGILQEIKPRGKMSLYETRVGDHHHHIVCRFCGRIEDVDYLKSVNHLSPADSHGFSVDETEVIFWGVCPSCKKLVVKQTKRSNTV